MTLTADTTTRVRKITTLAVIARMTTLPPVSAMIKRGEEMDEQYQRFCEALRTKDGYSTNCELCPIAEECYAFSAQLPSGENLKLEHSCEAILFRYVLTGEKPKIKEV